MWLTQQQCLVSRLWRVKSRIKVPTVGFSGDPSARLAEGASHRVTGRPPCGLCPNLLFRNGHQAYGIRTHPRGPMLTQLSPQRPDPQIQLYSEVLGVRASNTKLGDTQFIPHQGLSRRSQQHASFSEKPVPWKDRHPAARSGSSSIWQHLALPASVSAPISPTFS